MFFRHALVWRTISFALLLAIILAYDSQKCLLIKLSKKHFSKYYRIKYIIRFIANCFLCTVSKYYRNIFSFLYILLDFFRHQCYNVHK